MNIMEQLKPLWKRYCKIETPTELFKDTSSLPQDAMLALFAHESQVVIVKDCKLYDCDLIWNLKNQNGDCIATQFTEANPLILTGRKNYHILPAEATTATVCWIKDNIHRKGLYLSDTVCHRQILKYVKVMDPLANVQECLRELTSEEWDAVIIDGSIPVAYNDSSDVPLRIWDIAYNFKDANGLSIYPEYTLENPYLVLFPTPIPGVATWTPGLLTIEIRDKIYY